MSATPTLTKHQLFQSHLVNCNTCSKYESAGIEEIGRGGQSWKVSTKAKTKRFMCPVGVILFNEALKEDPSKSPFRPKFFPYVAKKFEKVRIRPKGKLEWVEGMVTDFSIGAHGQVVGYEVEVKTKSPFNVSVADQKDYYYVNPNNIKPLVTWKEKQNATKTVPVLPSDNSHTGKFVIHIGGS